MDLWEIPVSVQTIIQRIPYGLKPTRNLGQEVLFLLLFSPLFFPLKPLPGFHESLTLTLQLLSARQSSQDDKETRLVVQFRDFLEKCLELDPTRRMTVEEAIHHPFIQKES